MASNHKVAGSNPVKPTGGLVVKVAHCFCKAEETDHSRYPPQSGCNLIGKIPGFQPGLMGSSPFVRTMLWSPRGKAVDCKPAIRRFESSPELYEKIIVYIDFISPIN